jgi:hypothetical protein
MGELEAILIKGAVSAVVAWGGILLKHRLENPRPRADRPPPQVPPSPRIEPPSPSGGQGWSFGDVVTFLILAGFIYFAFTVFYDLFTDPIYGYAH